MFKRKLYPIKGGAFSFARKAGGSRRLDTHHFLGGDLGVGTGKKKSKKKAHPLVGVSFLYGCFGDFFAVGQLLRGEDVDLASVLAENELAVALLLQAGDA